MATAASDGRAALPLVSPAVRHALLLAHRWVGLSLADFLVVAGLTGSVLAFDEPLDAALNPDLFGGGNGPSLPITALIAAVQAADPGVVVSRVMLPNGVRRSVLLGVAATPDAPADEVFVDAASGRILGRRSSTGVLLAPGGVDAGHPAAA